MVVTFGGSAFWLTMGAGGGGSVAGLPATLRRMASILRTAVFVAALSDVAWLLATIANMTGDVSGMTDPDTLHAFFFETPFGTLAAVRMALLLGLVALAMPNAVMPRGWALAAISGLLLVSQAWLGHAAEAHATPYGAAMILCYAVHVLAGALWVGGLLPLGLALSEARGSGGQARGSGGQARLTILGLLSRYSLMATVAVILIVASGIANAGFRVGGAFPVLAATGYGDVLLVKSGLVAAMLALAAVNRFVLMARLRDERAEPSRSLRRILVSIAVEGGLGVLVLGAAAVLGITPPP